MAVIILILIIANFEAKSQLYAGVSYVYSQISESGLDQVKGFSFDLQGEINLPRERLSLMPTVRLAIMDSKIYN